MPSWKKITWEEGDERIRVRNLRNFLKDVASLGLKILNTEMDE